MNASSVESDLIMAQNIISVPSEFLLLTEYHFYGRLEGDIEAEETVEIEDEE